ncbi:histidine phosphatase family protein [Almyronema epifaneia]|uniref:Histidine phosphatase family protein n=1 Tax=Almyronema epifaneia S1 TaxID=2991925 RepID=A0ABW6ID82_9CYAN
MTQLSAIAKTAGAIAWVCLIGGVGCRKPPGSEQLTMAINQDVLTHLRSPERLLSSTQVTLGAVDSPENRLWSLLQQAETHYFVLIRHAFAPGTGDPANFQLNDCSTQRNLSAVGQAQARRTGAAFKQRNIAVRQVLSSQWCRCLETAELMEIGTVQPFAPLNSFFGDRRPQGPQQTAQIRAFMREQTANAGVTVMVTHAVNITALSGASVASGEMVVIQVDRQNQLEVLGQIEAL